jgi:hypothetical protein
VLIGAVMAAFAVLPAGAAAACDPLDPAACLYPWPNDHFTSADGSSPTGRRLALRDEWMPRNRLGKPVSSAPYNYSDGFSPGNMIVTKVPGLDCPRPLRAPERCRSPTSSARSTRTSRSW